MDDYKLCQPLSFLLSLKLELILSNRVRVISFTTIGAHFI